jgi:hypothetical protein
MTVLSRHAACLLLATSRSARDRACRGDKRRDAPILCEKDTIMADTVMGTVGEAGHAVAATTKKVGHAIAERIEQAACWVKEKTSDPAGKTEEVAGGTGDATKEAGQDVKDQAGLEALPASEG